MNINVNMLQNRAESVCSFYLSLVLCPLRPAGGGALQAAASDPQEKKKKKGKEEEEKEEEDRQEAKM